MLTEWEKIGTIKLISGILAVADPMLFPGLQVNLPPDSYEVLAGFAMIEGDRSLVCLRVVRSRGRFVRSNCLGEVIVDFAQVTVGDSVEVERAGKSICTQEAADVFVAELANISTVGEVSWNGDRSMTTPVVQSPEGDGAFSVYSLVREGVIAGIEVAFVEADSFG